MANGPKQTHQLPALSYDDYKRVIQRAGYRLDRSFILSGA